MGKKWDYDVPSEEIWRECFRVLKPGGHLLSFAGTRTQHRMAVRIEDAGFEIRDMIAWIYGSGFPKSLNIGKAVDKLQGNERTASTNNVDCEWLNRGEPCKGHGDNNGRYGETIHALPTKGTSPWEGWGTALKPALEPITVARKPLSEKTVAQNVLTHGTGGLNIDGCRVATTDKYSYPNGAGGNSFSVGKEPDGKRTEPVESNSLGRFPANLIHDGSEEVVGLFPESKSAGKYKNTETAKEGGNGMFAGGEVQNNYANETGSAARFFYCAKASKKDRDEGLEGFVPKNNMRVNAPRANEEEKHAGLSKNHHPTVKPTDLMRYLCRLVTPKGGTVLDPFMGSGSTGKAAKLEGFNFIGIEREAEYVEIAKARIENTHRPLTN